MPGYCAAEAGRSLLESRYPDDVPRRIEGCNHARFLTFSCYKRLDLFGSPRIGDEFVRILREARERRGFKLHAWVVMPNHVHLLVRPGGSAATVAGVLRAIKQPMAQRVLRRWVELDAPVLKHLRDRDGRSHFWMKGGGHDRNVFSAEEVEEKLRYIHENPVRAGLVTRPEDWAWSSAHLWDRRHESGVPIDPVE